jgi:RNA polymerase sigma factor (sigma-70 family)
MATALTSEGTITSLIPGFEDIFRDYANLVFATAYGVTRSREDAEDVVQTIFMRLFQSGLPPDFHKNPKGYLYCAATNQSLTLLRSRRRRPTADIDSATIPDRAAIEDPDEVLRRRLYEAIENLDAKAVQLLMLRYAQGYTDAEIAKLLGASRVSIAVRLHRAKARLKKLLLTSPGGNHETPTR